MPRGQSRADPTKLDTVGLRVRYARKCREVTTVQLAKYRYSWAPHEYRPMMNAQWFRDRERASMRLGYSLRVLESLARLLDVPLPWLLGEVSPYPPPIHPLSQVERFYAECSGKGNAPMTEYGRHWVMHGTGGALRGSIRI